MGCHMVFRAVSATFLSFYDSLDSDQTTAVGPVERRYCLYLPHSFLENGISAGILSWLRVTKPLPSPKIWVEMDVRRQVGWSQAKSDWSTSKKVASFICCVCFWPDGPGGWAVSAMLFLFCVSKALLFEAELLPVWKLLNHTLAFSL